MAIQFCGGNATCIRNTDQRRSVLTAQNVDVAQTSVGVTYFRFMECVNTDNVIYMCTTDTFAHDNNTNSTYAFDCLVRTKRLLE